MLEQGAKDQKERKIKSWESFGKFWGTEFEKSAP